MVKLSSRTQSLHSSAHEVINDSILIYLEQMMVMVVVVVMMILVFVTNFPYIGQTAPNSLFSYLSTSAPY